MSRKQNSLWTHDTRLDAIGIPYIDVVLTERFLLPPEALVKIGEKVPTTIGEIAELSGMPLQEISAVLEECLHIGKDIWLNVSSLSEVAGDEGTIIVDMRPNITFDTNPLHEDAKLFHAQSPQTFLAFLRTMNCVLVLSHSDAHAWSATMSLRKMSISAWMPRL